MKSLKKSFLILVIVIISAGISIAQDIPDPPQPPRLVNDFAGLLTSGEVNLLENKLVAFNDSTSTQIVIVTVKSLNGYDKNDFAQRLGQKWGVGQKGKDNGAVILVKPKYATEKGEATIQAGYGLEGALPDALCDRIVENEMIPDFREGNYFKGLDAATNTMISLVKGEFTADQYAKKAKSGKYGLLIPLVIILIVYLMIRSNRGKTHSVGKSLPFWTAMMLLGSMGRGSHSGSWGNFSGGGGGGGGFGGFGGGSFGGGGAGGSW
jgi:uncharacterized protein